MLIQVVKSLNELLCQRKYTAVALIEAFQGNVFKVAVMFSTI